jgi:prepilin-type N-terminal cleavage/methylation domain-containing protein
MRANRRDAGFSLLELMIAAVVVVILAMGLASSMGSAFMADNAARGAAASTNACQQTLEELQQMAYGDVLACDGDAMIGTENVAVKISAFESTTGLILIEVYACRPAPAQTLLALGGMTMAQVKALPAVEGSQVRLLTYRSTR